MFHMRIRDVPLRQSDLDSSGPCIAARPGGDGIKTHSGFACPVDLSLLPNPSAPRAPTNVHVR